MPDLKPDLRELRPAPKLVYKILEYEGPLAQSEIADHTLLHPRVVRRAADRLEDRGLISSRHGFGDAREVGYELEYQ